MTSNNYISVEGDEPPPESTFTVTEDGFRKFAPYGLSYLSATVGRIIAKANRRDALRRPIRRGFRQVDHPMLRRKGKRRD